MPAAEVVYKLSKSALRMVQNGTAEWTPGGIRDVHTKKILALARPILTTAVSNKQMLQNISQSLNSVEALAWANIAVSLVNLGVSVVGFYLTLKKMEALTGEIHQFIARYKSDKEADQLQEYKTHLNNLTSHLNFLQCRYTLDEYNKQIFIIRETDVETECNETASFLDRILSQYQKKEISEKLACQILFTLSPIYAQLVNEYCCQYYCTHKTSHAQFEAWKNILDQINSDSFRQFMKREMAFNIQYADLSPQKRSDALTLSFECVQELIDNLTTSAEIIKTAPEDTLISVSDLLNAKTWDEIRDQIQTKQDESPEEYFRQQLNQIAINDDGEEEVYVPLQMRYA